MTVRAAHRAEVGHATGGTGMSKLAFWMAVVILAVVVLAAGIFAIAHAVGGADATSDNWVGVTTVFGVVGGLLSSIGAFALGLLAWRRHERTPLLWLPLLLFPALLTFLVLGEAFWWE